MPPSPQNEGDDRVVIGLWRIIKKEKNKIEMKQKILHFS